MSLLYVLALSLVLFAALGFAAPESARELERVNPEDAAGLRPVAPPRGIRPVTTPWSRCDKTCGGGKRTRIYNGRKEEMSCNNNPCTPVPLRCKLDLVFVLDTSGSVRESNWWRVKQFAIDIARSLPVSQSTTRIGVVTYSSGVFMKFHLNQHNSLAAVESAIWGLPYQPGGTNTAGALQTMRTTMFTAGNGDRAGVLNVGILVTDGWSNNKPSTIMQGNLAKQAGIKMYAVGIGSNVNVNELKSVASDPDSTYYHQVAGFSALQTIVQSLVKSACSSSSSTTCCSICGDPHYNTFDGQMIHYQGACKYNLATPTGKEFRIEGANENRYSSSHVSYLKYIDITYGGVTVRLDKHKVLKVNGITRSVPHTTVNGIHIQLSGGYLIATLPNGVVVRYNGNACGRICVPSTYLNVMTGICGNYDNNAVNDLRTAAGQQVPGNSAGYKQIGDSWRVYDPENPRCINNDYQTPTCPQAVLTRVRSRYYCGLLLERNGPFRACATKVDLKKFFEACEQDVCAAYPDGRLMKAMACNALENVEQECGDQGLEVTDWRRLSGCSSAPQYGPWSAWGKCSTTTYKRCYQVRTRECLSGDCSGPFSQRRACICGGGVDGGWSSWGSWSSCIGKPCGRGYRIRRRSCTNPRPSAGGKPCSGASYQRVSCTVPCANDCARCRPYINNRCHLPHPTTCTQYYVCLRRPVLQQATLRPPVKTLRQVASPSPYSYYKFTGLCPPRTGWNQFTKKCDSSLYPCRNAVPREPAGGLREEA